MREKYVIFISRTLSQTIDAHGGVRSASPILASGPAPSAPSPQGLFCEGFHGEPTFHHFGGMDWVIVPRGIPRR